MTESAPDARACCSATSSPHFPLPATAKATWIQPLQAISRATWVSMSSIGLASTAPRVALSSLSRLGGSLARVSPTRGGTATSPGAASAAATPAMGRGGEGQDGAVSASIVIEAVAETEQRPVRVNPRTDKFGVQRFHHVEFWTADATAAAKRLAPVGPKPLHISTLKVLTQDSRARMSASTH